MTTMRRRIGMDTGEIVLHVAKNSKGSQEIKGKKTNQRKTDSELSLKEFNSRIHKMFNDKTDQDVINRLSHKFAADFHIVLSRCYGNTKVEANSVYMQYMLNENNVHIVKTKWKTFDEFIRYQGRLGQFLVEYKDRVWFIQIPSKEHQQSPLAIFQKDKISRSESKLLDFGKDKSEAPNTSGDSNGHQLSLSKSVEQRKKDSSTAAVKRTFHDGFKNSLNRKLDSSWSHLGRDKVTFKVLPRTSPYTKHQRTKVVFKSDKKHEMQTKRPKSTLMELMEEQERLKERIDRKEYWLESGIIVRIISSKYGSKHVRKRCRIVGLVTPYSGVAHVLGSEHIMMVEQKHLSTVIPEVGHCVRVVNGAYRGEFGTLECVGSDSECSVRIKGGLLSGSRRKKVYNELCMRRTSQDNC